VTLFALAVLALCLWYASVAHAETRRPTFIDRLVSAQAGLQSKRDEPVDALELANAVARLPHISGEWAALILTVAGHETALSARIARGDCKSWECDSGKAWGLYQIHRNALNADSWGSPDIGVQTSEAARALRRAFYTCQHGPLRADWVARTINAYAGHSCDAIWPGLTRRVATFERLRRRL
jgi:hypothetical protein